MKDQNNPFDDVLKEEFEQIQHHNTRPKGMPYHQYKSIQQFINKMNNQKKGQLVFNSKNYKQKEKGQTYKK